MTTPTREQIAERLWNCVAPGRQTVPWSELESKKLRALTFAQVDEVAALLEEARAAAFAEACVVARGACRAGENCGKDGGCRHVPCITARMIEGELRARALAAAPQGVT
jgi:hypothetical protein